MITASIVLFHTEKEMVDQAIRSFSPNEDRILFLIDNSSKACVDFDGKDHLIYIFNGKNLGYGAAHNIAIRKAIELGANYHVVLNPDVTFEPSVIGELARYAATHTDVVYMLPKVLYPNGDTQHLCKLLPTPFDLIFRRFLPKSAFIQKWNDRYVLKEFGYDAVLNPPCLSGCFMFLRVSALKQSRILFDERFFMYCEDFDLIRRLHRLGKTIYYPFVTVVHRHAKGSYQSGKLLRLHMKSAILYFNKYGWMIDPERRRENRKILREVKGGGKGCREKIKL